MEKKRSTPKSNFPDTTKFPMFDSSLVPRIVVPPQMPIKQKADIKSDQPQSPATFPSDGNQDDNQLINQSGRKSSVSSPAGDMVGALNAPSTGIDTSPNSPCLSSQNSPYLASGQNSPHSSSGHNSPCSFSGQTSPCYSPSANQSSPCYSPGGQNSPCLSQAQPASTQYTNYINQIDGESDHGSGGTYYSPNSSPSSTSNGNFENNKMCVLSQYVTEPHLSCCSPRSIDSVAFISNDDKMNSAFMSNDQSAPSFGMNLDEIDIDPLFFSNFQDTSADFCQDLQVNNRKFLFF